ncbi:voltage-gated chloride channel family protein [Halopseudomonas salegens]|uniref:H+/Cl-antiporter ClcA n=1 Tax=Halopseudomonas salegens TaxID=1434072 RepID=A0A1H2GNA2_9GAMM|nr:voltage-gated chloride channel family protein [Halopseudomonas salegens]SDU20951.1 H+/Cl-antiporter ClcA [Halopseudomonas salegens]
MRIPTLPPYLALLGHVIKWLLLATLVALLAGSASAAFIYGLDWATDTRNANRWLIWLLPVAGFVVGWVYLRWGESVAAGNNLLLDEIHDTRKVVPLRMAPLVLWGTITSHLFGASVGREGTAVQMGGSLADQLTGLFRLSGEDRRIILMAGISAGFASVFGTPLGAAVFALEVLATGRLRYEAILPCLVAAILADQVALWWGIQHDHYLIPEIPSMSLWGLTAMVLAGIIFGLTARLFAEATHSLTGLMRRKVSYSPLRPFIGGVVIAAAVFALGTDRYIGLGIPVIMEAFEQPLAPWDFAGKLMFTVVSLGSGFKGGEVTPLFYIGATLGNALAPILNMPFGLLAAVGFVAVFSGAANTPLASTLMAMELFGAEIGLFAGIACVVSYLFSGHTGIYSSQRLGHRKLGQLPEGLKLGEVADWRKRQGEQKKKDE